MAAVVLVATTVRTLWSAEAARAAWSASTPVVVATADLSAGTVLTDANLRVVGLPPAVVPPGAATGDPAGLVGATVSETVLRGEPVAVARLGPPGLGPTAARLRPGWRAVAMPLGAARPPLQPGDRVELVGVAGGPGSGAAATIVARTAEVLAVDEDALTVAVPAEDVTGVVGAVASGLVAAVLVGA